MDWVPFFNLARLGIGHHQIVSYSNNFDWNDIKTHAIRQGLLAVVLDGIERIPENKRPPRNELLQWIGNTFKDYEYRYELYRRSIAELAGWYNAHGFKMMVLKGYACSINWPNPEHRPCGDIDIWLFGQQKEADAILLKEKGIGIDNSHHHHTVFYWRGIMVENHYDFVNIHHSKSNASIERIFKQLGSDETHFVDVYGEKVYFPSPNLHALFLLRHSMTEFAASGITLRHLLDWAFFVHKHGKEVDWEWLENTLEQYGMKLLYNVFNVICIEDLGFDACIFPSAKCIPGLKEKVLNEILNPAIPNEKPQRLIVRIIWKLRRWKTNVWKHKLVYKESLWSAFWSGVWNHILKPSSI